MLDLEYPLEPNLEEILPFTGIDKDNPFKLPVGADVGADAKLLAFDAATDFLFASAAFLASSAFLVSYSDTLAVLNSVNVALAVSLDTMLFSVV